MNILSGKIGGAHQITGNTTFPIASVSGTPNAFQAGIVSIAPDDTINVVYGGIYSSVSGAVFDANLPIPDDTNLQIGGFIISTDGLGRFNPLQNVNVPQPLLWRRPFLNTGIGNGVQPNFIQEFPVSGVTDGVNRTYGLSQIPLNAESVLIVIDGTEILDLSDWTLNGPLVTLNSPIGIGQSIYFYYVAAGQSMVSGQQEIPAGVIDGVNLNFTLQYNVANRSSLILFKDGLVVTGEKWNLIQGIGHQPVNPQNLYAFYLVNINTQLQNLGGGGGGGTREVHGSFAAPVSVNPISGIMPTTAMDQVWWVIPTSPGVFSTFISTLGAVIGARLTLKGGVGAGVNYLTIADGAGTSQDGRVDLTDQQAITYSYDGAEWSEDSRRV
jgi:hypothetical protein